MGSVNIGGQSLHTSNISSSGSISTFGLTSSGSTFVTNVTSRPYSTYTIRPQKTTYHLFGEDITIEGYADRSKSLNVWFLLIVLVGNIMRKYKNKEFHFQVN
jgi:hypothetical protein